MKNFIINNRNERNPLNTKNIPTLDAKTLDNWINAVEELRIIASDIQAGNYNGKNAETEKKNAFFAAEKKVLAFFKNKSIGERLPAESADFETVLGLVAEIKKQNKESEKEFLPRSKRAFRKRLEIFLADRLTKREARTAEEIEEERKARRAAEKARKTKTKKAKSEDTTGTDVDLTKNVK